MSPIHSLLLPNLGAEEGDDWRAFRYEPSTRVAARLWSCLFSRNTVFRAPRPGPAENKLSFTDQLVGDLWPCSLGEPPETPAYPWVESPRLAIPWLRTSGIETSIELEAGLRLAGPSPRIVARMHDKAFAVEAARDLDLLPKRLAPLISVLERDEFADPDRVVEALSKKLQGWPEWTRKRFTLKPRFGSSGRGRVGGAIQVDSDALRGALPRLAARGGAIFEPWLDRRVDLSVCLFLAEEDALPTLLGSLEILATPSGVYRGHCGEIDHRGRVFSGHRDDESLRAQAASVAARAKQRGYRGACGIDSFVYLESDSTGEREYLRPAVEFNARPTMGLVTLGLLRRALPNRRRQLGLEPGDRGAFLLVLLKGNASQSALRIAEQARCETKPIPLAAPQSQADEPQPFLFFGRDLASLRAAYRDHRGC